jgi:aryl-alcohol dehydrogenase-like predicted oxidoreductase
MKDSSRMGRGISRRQFIQTTALAGAALAGPWRGMNAIADDAPTTVRTATDQVTLGNTGMKLSRLGFGTGSNNGRTQTAQGKAAFVDLIHYAYDHGITFIDTAESYVTFGVIADAIKGLPREKLFIQSKMEGSPADALAAIDNHRKTFNTDYVDSLLVHCVSSSTWSDQRKRAMDALDQAKEKKWIKAKGVSCHTLPALRSAVAMDWTDVHLVRVNPQGAYVDAEAERDNWRATGGDIKPVLEQIKATKAKGRGVIGMKLCGNGTFTNPDDREKSIRFAMSQKEIDAVIIGFKNRAEIDEAIERINRALKEV